MLDFDTLADVRSAIDQIDQLIVGLLAQRGRCVREAARFKTQASEVPAPERVAQVMAKVDRQARELGADPAVVETVYRHMIEGFIRLERAHQAAAHPTQAQCAPCSGSR
jgi:isochorismate pyruvate lyase